MLSAFADRCAQKKDEIVSAIQGDIGKPLSEAETEIIEARDIIAYYATQDYAELADIWLPVNTELWKHKRVLQTREPLGVVGVIKPWNYPFELPLWAIVPVLIAGNTIVFKPSEHSSATGCILAKVMMDAGIPNGVLNVVTGKGNTGRLLAEHPGVNGLSFTGSNRTGTALFRKTSRCLRKISLELGGNDAAIVLEDADMGIAIPGLTWGAFTNAGQVCTAIQRVIVSEGVYNETRERLIASVQALRPLKDYGPLVCEAQLRKVTRFVGDAVAKGARVLCGGKRLRPPGCENGFYYEPTVLENVSREALIWREEVFGPVISLMPYKNIDDAIVLANDSQYGLGTSIWTSDRQGATQLARRIETGMVWINEVNLPIPSAAWVGWKNSGFGFNLSRQAVEDATRVKVIHVDADSEKRGWWFPYQ
jgi:acyl-CoA reductase-like NAD-dependent aldehyde dehydrogenase